MNYICGQCHTFFDIESITFVQCLQCHTFYHLQCLSHEGIGKPGAIRFVCPRCNFENISTTFAVRQEWTPQPPQSYPFKLKTRRRCVEPYISRNGSPSFHR